MLNGGGISFLRHKAELWWRIQNAVVVVDQAVELLGAKEGVLATRSGSKTSKILTPKSAEGNICPQ